MNSLSPDEPVLTLNALGWMTLGMLGLLAGVFGVVCPALRTEGEDQVSEKTQDWDPVQCQGCGRYSTTARIGDPHNCWRNEDGTYEEGGTFQ